jgi:menaquinone-9 beta-reductase
MDHYAVAIVGGGPAGLASALFLAHAKPALTERIVVLEKDRYPRDKTCGGAIGARADDLLASIGVHVDVPGVELRELSIRSPEAESNGRVARLGRVVRRVDFDAALAHIARARGIQIVEGAAVHGLCVRDQCVELDSERGRFSAEAVIGADGVSGYVRRALGLPPGRLRAQAIVVDTEPVAADRGRDVLHVDFFSRDFTGYAWAFPTRVDGQPMVCRGIYHLKLDERRVDLGRLLRERLAQHGLELKQYRARRFTGCGFEAARSYAAPRLALVGEAAGIDAATGEGIAQAIGYGAFAGRYLAEQFAEGDLSFRDWDTRLSREEPARTLRAHERQLHQLFGPRRALFERHVLSLPAFAQISAEQMAGLPESWGRFWREASAHALRALIGQTALKASAAVSGMRRAGR